LSASIFLDDDLTERFAHDMRFTRPATARYQPQVTLKNQSASSHLPRRSPWTDPRPTSRCAPPAAAAGGVRPATPELRSASASPAAPPIPNARAGGPFFCSRDVAQSVLQHVARARDLADDVCDRSPMPFRPDVFRVADVRRQEESLQGAMWSR
jgi:hypothetical protein